VPVSGSFLVHGGHTATFKSADATFLDDVAITTLLPNGQTLVVVAAANGDSIVVQQGSNSFTLASGEQTVVNGETVSASDGALVVIHASETVSLSLLPASATMGNSGGGFPGGSGIEKTASPVTRSDFTGKTADGGDASSSTSIPEAESLSAGVGRGSIDSARGLLLFVLVVACVGLL
jgi:hypothetical protein